MTINKRIDPFASVSNEVEAESNESTLKLLQQVLRRFHTHRQELIDAAHAQGWIAAEISHVDAINSCPYSTPIFQMAYCHGFGTRRGMQATARDIANVISKIN